MTSCRTKASRKGTVVLVVLACLIITSALVTTTVQSALRGRIEARNARQLRQTELLCEAGVMRSVERLRQSADYQGETWKPKLNIPQGEEEASFERPIIEIRVKVPSNDGQERNIEVVAKLASKNNSHGPMQRSHTFTTTLSSPSVESK